MMKNNKQTIQNLMDVLDYFSDRVIGCEFCNDTDSSDYLKTIIHIDKVECSHFSYPSDNFFLNLRSGEDPNNSGEINIFEYLMGSHLEVTTKDCCALRNIFSFTIYQNADYKDNDIAKVSLRLDIEVTPEESDLFSAIIKQLKSALTDYLLEKKIAPPSNLL